MICNFLFHYWGLSQELCLCYSNSSTTELHPHPFLFISFCDVVSLSYSAGLIPMMFLTLPSEELTVQSCAIRSICELSIPSNDT